MQKIRDFHYVSVNQREEFWRREGARIHWDMPPQQTLDDSRLPFARWFVGGKTNLCYNAVDRWVPLQGDRQALIWVSTEVDQERIYTQAQLHEEVNAVAAMLREQGVGQGDRVLVYMPMVPEAVFTMLACARLGAIHSVVFGGFAAHNLAQRIDDARPKVIVSADAGSRGGKVMAYKPLLDQALTLCQSRPAAVIVLDRGLAPAPLADGEWDYAQLRTRHEGARVPVTWLESSEPSYILYTSGTTGKPKGVQRDTGGYTVALAASMEYIFDGKPGETFFCTSDIGWVVGHSYIVYGPLIGGQATLLYEGTPLRPDAAILWRLVERYKVNTLFSAPTAVRVLKRQDPELLRRHDLSSLRAIYLAGEPLDEPTARWIGEAVGKPIIDNYWQTESGWPILSAQPGVERTPPRLGSPSFPTYGYDVRVVDENTGQDLEPGRKGVVAIVPPLPPGAMSTIWGDDERFVRTYFESIPGRQVYSTFDWGLVDDDGYWFILGRTDDVINVAGHRLGTREIEESLSSHGSVAECAVVGVADALKGQVAQAFVVLKDPGQAEGDAAMRALEGDMMRVVDQQLGPVARPARILFVAALPKTRSGKVLRRAIVAVCEGRDPGDLATIEDPNALELIKESLR
ncbi:MULTISPECIES: propionate--CoA ligase [unclassified Achromobacter]|uniref:propionate--CoA ligase n=1 Tax=unclassified Achromobacter TaxID=2626865 RepID=UPI000B51C25A|nr:MULTISPECIES: propionate--CoA ligase [unclassified Achromobacter]OWT77471.1 propionate--CoA ligase [Achromobacter sp. HZ28]OWT78352.1 propionate--CoA ligase [Achromobacter sp. HZ34]